MQPNTTDGHTQDTPARTRFERWLAGYLECWKSNGPRKIGELFSEDARYFTQPFRDPWTGRQAIVAGWLSRADDQGSWEFDYRWVAVEGDTGVLEGTTTYHDQEAVFHNVWFVTLDSSGQCTEFREQWIQKPAV
jgi:hypothetical protein